MRMKSLCAIGLLLAGAACSYAQQGRSPGGSGNTSGRQSGGSTQGRSGMSTGQQGSFGRMGQQQQGLNQPEFQRPVYLSGKVMLADGTPPGEPVTIERVCWGERRPETYTDSKGRFSFQLGDKHSLAFADAGTSPASDDAFGGAGFNSGGFDSRRSPGAPAVSAFGRVDLSGCELRAVLPGYRSESVQLNQRSIFDKPDVGVIILHRIAKGHGISVSATSLAAPKQARKAYEKALKELRKKDAESRKPKKAAKELEKAVAAYPEYAAAWTLLGRTRLSINDKEGAREAFDKAARILGLGFPGGPEIQRVSHGVTSTERLPRAWMGDTLDFSFSGIKTALLHMAQAKGIYPPENNELGPEETAKTVRNLAGAFQESLVDVMSAKLMKMAIKYRMILLSPAMIIFLFVRHSPRN